MHNSNDTTTQTAKGDKPAFRAWLTQDRPDGTTLWTEVSGLWPTKSATGYSGRISNPITATAGRLVILPATINPAAEPATEG